MQCSDGHVGSTGSACIDAWASHQVLLLPIERTCTICGSNFWQFWWEFAQVGGTSKTEALSIRLIIFPNLSIASIASRKAGRDLTCLIFRTFVFPFQFSRIYTHILWNSDKNFREGKVYQIKSTLLVSAGSCLEGLCTRHCRMRADPCYIINSE